MQASGPPRWSSSTLHRRPGPGDLQTDLPLPKYLDTKREGPLTASLKSHRAGAIYPEVSAAG